MGDQASGSSPRLTTGSSPEATTMGGPERSEPIKDGSPGIRITPSPLPQFAVLVLVPVLAIPRGSVHGPSVLSPIDVVTLTERNME